MQKGDRVFVTSACNNGEIINVRKGKHDAFFVMLDDGRTFSTYDYDLRLLHPPKPPEEKYPEEKGPEQMFPEQKNPEEKSPVPKFKVGDRVLTLNYGMCTICRYDKHSNTYDVVDDFGYVRGDFREKELTSAGTCTTPEEQKETTQKETSCPKKKFEVGEKVVVTTPKYGGKFDGTILDIQIKDDTYYLVSYDYPQGVYLLPEHHYLKEKNLEKKEMNCCKETTAPQTTITEISLQDAYERIRRELERNPLYYNAWKDKLTRQIENYLGAEFADDDIYKILAGLFKLAKPTATFDSFH